ncbi:PTS sugar transporter subunit IIA [Rhodopila sp.]|uniref:PTS sugar transporter subunit IIA n=1 Tax=Rhodopila sp. TaxID=2480087 RepID=UPI003D139E22
MDIDDFLNANRVVLGLRARDKPSLLTEAARIAAGQMAGGLMSNGTMAGGSATGISRATIEAALLAREQLGSTGLGAGFALPHARIEGLSRFLGVFIRLARPIDFDAIDGKPVDLVFLLLIPAGAADHVSALAAVSRRFRDTALVTRIREVANPATAFGLLTNH